MIDLAALVTMAILGVAIVWLAIKGHMMLPICFAAAIVAIGIGMSIYSSKRFNDRCRAEGGTVHHGKTDLCVSTDGTIIRITVK